MKGVGKMEKKYLSEEEYQKNKKKIEKAALIVLICGLLLGGSLIGIGIVKQVKVNSNYSSSSKEKLQQEIDDEKASLESIRAELEAKRSDSLSSEKKKLEDKKSELIAKGIKYDSFTKYDDGEAYDLKIITEVLDPSFSNCLFDEYKDNSLTSSYCYIINNKDDVSKGINAIDNVLNSDYCSFSEYKNNSYTSKYCSLKSELSSKTDTQKRYDSFDSKPLYAFGGMIILTTCAFAGMIFMTAKRREIIAFQTQQVMPVAKEGALEMAPTIGKTAEEITKGIKKGLSDKKEKDTDDKENDDK